MAKSTQSKTGTTSIEETIQSLEKIISELEQNDTPVEVALKQFENGIRLTRQAQDALQQAEQRVQQLTATDDELDSPADAGEE